MNPNHPHMNERATRAWQWTTLAAAVLGVTGSIALSASAAEPTKALAQRYTPEEARRTLRLMNDIYVSGVLTTHKMYVLDRGTAAAVTWGKQVINQITAKGWPEAHIFSTTERSFSPDNRPQDEFEKAANLAFQRGKTELERTEGDSLRYATPLRVTDQSCLMCHVHNKVGDLLGGVSYRALLKPAASK